MPAQKKLFKSHNFCARTLDIQTMSDARDTDAGSTEPSDEEDRLLFAATLLPGSVAEILRLKRDDPEVTHFSLFQDMNEETSRRLSHILGQNTHLTDLNLPCNFDVAGLCAELQTNRFIQVFALMGGVDLSGAVEMNRLVPFLVNNPSFVVIHLFHCNIGPDSIGILVEALSSCSASTLRGLNLGGNNFGGVDLGPLCQALVHERHSGLTELHLPKCGIGQHGCASLATLLQGHSSRGPQVLNLCQNSINDQSARVLADFLDRNSRLITLNLNQNSGITAHGWRAFLDLVCDARSIGHTRASNHTLCSLGDANPFDHGFPSQTFVGVLGAEDANFLDALLALNGNSDKTLVVKHKLIWSHIQGRSNIGDCPLVAGLMPQVLACFSAFPNEVDALFLHPHQPRPSDLELAVMRLEAMFRILRSRFDLCQGGSDPPCNARVKVEESYTG